MYNSLRCIYLTNQSLLLFKLRLNTKKTYITGIENSQIQCQNPKIYINVLNVKYNLDIYSIYFSNCSTQTHGDVLATLF